MMSHVTTRFCTAYLFSLVSATGGGNHACSMEFVRLLEVNFGIYYSKTFLRGEKEHTVTSRSK